MFAVANLMTCSQLGHGRVFLGSGGRRKKCVSCDTRGLRDDEPDSIAGDGPSGRYAPQLTRILDEAAEGHRLATLMAPSLRGLQWQIQGMAPARAAIGAVGVSLS